MGYIKLLLNLLIVFIFWLLGVNIVFSQTYELNPGGVILDGTTLPVCANTDYTITRATGSGQDRYVGSSANVLFDGASSTTAVCGNAITVKVRFLTAGTHTVTISTKTGPCGTPTTETNINGFDFQVQAPASITNSTLDFDLCTNDIAGEVDLTPTYSPVSPPSLSSQWYKDDQSMAGAVLATTSTHKVPDSDFSVDGEEHIYTVEITYGALSCTDTAHFSVTRRDAPSTGAIGGVPVSMCTNGIGSGTPTVECTASCGSSYTWEYSVAGANSYSAIGSFGSNNTSSDINTLTLNGTTNNAPPGTYDIRAIVGNAYCSVTATEVSNGLIVNDIPAVEIEHDNGASDWLSASTGNATICSGRALKLRPKDCDGLNYDNQGANGGSNTSNASGASPGTGQPNVLQSDNSTGIAYTSACTGTGNTYFSNLKWTTSLAVTFTGSGSPSGGNTEYTVGGVGVPGNATENQITIANSTVGAATYTLEVTGENGCVNTDNVVITIEDPVITFSSNNSVYNSGETVIGCIGQPLQISALCNICEVGFSDVDWEHSATENGLANGISPAENLVTVTSTTISADPANTYTVTVTDNGGCTNTATIIVDDAPSPSIDIAQPTPLCSDGDLQLIDNNFSGAYNYSIYDTDPSVGTPIPVFSCTGISLSNSGALVGSDNCTGIPAISPIDVCISFDIPTTYENPNVGGSGSNSSCASPGNSWDDAWYSFTATAASTIIQATTSQNMVLAVYASCGDNTAIACNATTGGGTASVTVATTPTTVYFIQLHRQIGVTPPDTWTGDLCIYDAALSGGCGAGNTITATGVTPIDGQTYWLEAISGDCTDDDFIDVTVTTTPEINPGTTSPYTYPYPVCDGYYRYFSAYTYSGGTSFSWQFTPGVCEPGGPPPGTSNCPAPGGYSYGSKDYEYDFGSFSYSGFRMNSGAPIQTDASLLVTADNGGCSSTFEYILDVEICTDPELEMSTRSGNTEITQNYNSANTTTYAPVNYVCEGDIVRFDVDNPSQNSDTWYEWDSGESGPTVNSIDVQATAAIPDTIRRTVQIKELINNGGSVDTINTPFSFTHTVVISRGNVNWYPIGDGDDSNTGTSIDSAICINDILYNQANCPECKGNITYNWDALTQEDQTNNGSDYQVYSVGPVTTTTTPPGTKDFTVELILSHGELDACTETLYREIDVNELPTVALEYSDDAGATFNTVPTSEVLYLCDSTTQILRLSCGTCTTYDWNTLATTQDINVSSQGGYFGEGTDPSGCRQISSPVVIVDALDGLNAVVTANPSEICDGNQATLEVTPCVGCTYKWFDGLGGGQPNTDPYHSTSTVGDYYVEITNEQGCVYQTEQVTLSETTLTIPSITTNTDSICSGKSATLSTVSGTNYKYQWYWNNGNSTNPINHIISAATNSTYTTFSPGTYKVEVTYPNGCVVESSLLVIHSAEFTPNINYSDTIICKGDSVGIETALVGGWQYQWYKNGIAITGNDGTGSVYSAQEAGSYYVEVTNYNLCVAQSTIVDLTKTSIDNPNATTNTPTVCPGEFGELSVSLCTECSYEWFDCNNISQSYNSTLGYNYDSVTVSGCYYAVVSLNGCSERSDSVEIIVNSVFTPAITSSSSVVCEGRNATLVTQSCVGCSYEWLIDGSPVLGALNDTFHIVDDVVDIGDYQIAVDYPNGCSDTSATLTIGDGSYSINLYVDSMGLPADYVICNGTGEDLIASTSPTSTGTYLYTLFLDNTPIANFTTNQPSQSFLNTNQEGVYTVQSTDPLGCKELSNPLTLTEVTVAPVLSAHPTASNTNAAQAICTDSGSVFMQVANCPGCTYEWTQGGNPIAGYSNTTNTTYLTDTGSGGTGVYIVNATNNGCSAGSNQIVIGNLIGTMNSNAFASDSSICSGQAITLEHTASLGNPSVNCNNNCTFRWLRKSLTAAANIAGSPINGATSYQYITGTEGYYYLELSNQFGCVDTSQAIPVIEVNPPAGLSLNLDSVLIPQGGGTPLASNGTVIDLDDWVFPDSVQNKNISSPGVSSYFTNTPFSGALNCNGALPCNPGLSGLDSNMFTPHDTLAGYHLITYHYDSLGCVFTAEDILEVLPPAAITVANDNINSVPYEACVGDSLTITTVNLDFPIDQVWAFDENDNYIQMSIGNVVVTPATFGADTRYSTTIGFTVPGSANASYLMLINTAGGPPDTTFTPFVLIHNTDLSFTGLPTTLCSNSSLIALSGNPSGGYFYATSPGNTNPSGLLIDTIQNNLLNTGLLPTSAYANGSQYVDIYYSYTETFTNGNECPSNDTVSIQKEVKDVRLTSVDFNEISVSQDQELLTNLVERTIPYEAAPNKGNYTVSFSGSFTNPAGNPLYFQPKNAGIGTHSITYSIQSGICTNSVTNDITVKAAPTPIAIPDTICRNHGIVSFCRDVNYPSSITGTNLNANDTYTDSFNVMNVYSTQNSAGMTPGVAHGCFDYDPTAVSGSYDTLVVEYWFYRDEDTSGTDFDKLNYVIGRVYQPIFIENLNSVSIDTIVQPFYCQENTLHLLSGTPNYDSASNSGGTFMLFGGTGQYEFGDTLFNNVINPYSVNSGEPGVTTYQLYYILDGLACQNSDSMAVTISKGLNPMFSTANGLDEFCDTDLDVAINHNVLSPDTAIWKIGGVPQPSYVFPPDPLDPGTHVVELLMKDSFGCTATVKDTFTINALPSLMTTPDLGLQDQYCANDPVVDFVVDPIPFCSSVSPLGRFLVDAGFDQGVPGGWTVLNISGGSQWEPNGFNTQGGSAGAMFVDTNSVDNDSWLITDSLDLVTGHTYRLSYMYLAGPLDPNCASGFCDATMRVSIGNQILTSSLGTVLADHPLISNEQAYVNNTLNYTHTAGTGKYFIAFRNQTQGLGRSLRLENVKLRDVTPEACLTTGSGVGYVNGLGTHHVKDSLYQFNPLSVEPGNIEVKYIYTDEKGCQDSLVYPIRVDSFPIVSFTDMDSSYCINEPTVMLTGSPLGGAFSTSNSTNNLVHIPFIAPTDTAWYPVNYMTNEAVAYDTVFYTYTDNQGCSETAWDVVSIVNLLDSLAIHTNLDPFGIGHCIDGSTVTLATTSEAGDPNLANGANGTFYGAGVRNGHLDVNGATFHPDSAVIDMGHIGDVTIDYIYQTTTGCWDTTSRTTHVHALPDLEFMNLPDSLCLNEDSIQVVALNHVITGAMGEISYIDTLLNQGAYSVFDTSGNQIFDFIALFDSLAPANADGYNQMNVNYMYTTDPALGACTNAIFDSVRIDTVPITYFQGMQDFYCENELPSIILAYPPYKVGSGYLLLDTMQIDSSFLWVNPATMVGAGLTTAVYPLYYTYTDTRGCTGEVFDTFEVRPYPRIQWNNVSFMDTFCRVQGATFDLTQNINFPLGGIFTDNLALSSILQDTLLDLNSVAGPRVVTYHYTDDTTACYNSADTTLYLFNSPDLGFNVFGGCAGMDITFDGYATNLVAGIDSITSIAWEFDTPGPLTNSPLDTSPTTLPDIVHNYGATGVYTATLHVTNQGNCVTTTTNEVIISPTELPAPYVQDFNTGDGNWYNDQEVTTTPSPVWTHEPAITGNQIVSGNGAWTTMANTLYEKGQSAWVYPPCIDFTNSQRPMISMDLWRDMLDDIDGLIMEFYNPATFTWERVGDLGQGINWYQSNFVLSRPGNQETITYPRGWTGRSGGYENVRLRLDPFRGQNHVRFRFAFASSPQTVIDTTGSGYEGVAIDNVWIGERTRNVLVEHFNNEYYVPAALTPSISKTVDEVVYDKVFNSAYGLDVVLAQYQIGRPSSSDVVYQSNTADPNARDFFYAINDAGKVFIDGESIGSGNSQDLSEYHMDYNMLQFPDFDIQITTPVAVNVGGQPELQVSATVEALVNKDSAEYAIHTLVIQDSMTYYSNPSNSNSGGQMLSIMRKMLPNASGQRESHAWTPSQVTPVNHTWNYGTVQNGSSSFNVDQLEIIVFIQNMDTKEIYQVATTQDLNKYTGTGQIEDEIAAEIFNMNVYPNPSQDFFNVKFDEELKGDYDWSLVDVTGRVLQTGQVQNGTEQFVIDATKLTNGAYFFVINGENVTAQRKLVVIK